MSKIYVPDLDSYKCVVVQNSTTLRAYKSQPRNNSSSDYRDYYYTSNYVYTDGNQSWGNYSTLPVCLSTNDLTNDYYYRNDFPQILLMFLIIVIFSFWFPWRILTRMFRRWT